MNEPRVFQFLVLDPPTPMGRKRFSGQTESGKHFYAEKKDVRSLYFIRRAFQEAYPDEPLITGAVSLRIALFHKAPMSMSRKKKMAAWMKLQFMTTKPDFNNVVNQVCDALSSYAYVDDRQITYGECKKFYAVDQDGNDTPPRMAITVEEIGDYD